jgi:hypothetical protein
MAKKIPNSKVTKSRTRSNRNDESRHRKAAEHIAVKVAKRIDRQFSEQFNDETIKSILPATPYDPKGAAISTGVSLPKHKSTSAIFADAPSRALLYPQTGNITAAEIMAFLPNSVRSHDIVFRFASNGATNKIMSTMANYFRQFDTKGAVDKNTLCHIMQKAMRDHGYDLTDANGNTGIKWTNTLHKTTNMRNQDGPWDGTNLTLRGVLPQCAYYLGDYDNENEPIDNVPFASLATGVQRFPSIELGDGLDLTRCVQYAKAHPQEKWLFPCDFQELTRRLGGAIVVQEQHLDRAAFRRWNNGQTPQPPAPVMSIAPRIAVVMEATVAPQAPVVHHPIAPKPQNRVTKSSQDRVEAARTAANFKNKKT